MSVTKKTLVGTIDCTPTWSEVLHALLTAYEEGSPVARGIALQELQRMARLADAQVAAQKGDARG